jgi:hypothetical protein
VIKRQRLCATERKAVMVDGYLWKRDAKKVERVFYLCLGFSVLSSNRLVQNLFHFETRNEQDRRDPANS